MTCFVAKLPGLTSEAPGRKPARLILSPVLGWDGKT